ncbi:magnesium chelatase subunit D [Tabrizicola sp.]|uniref:magnesium chelatase subunit D n=1 Tax=Tabrizicola sp. TaxID=2005166 RepID=UPI003F3986ED
MSVWARLDLALRVLAVDPAGVGGLWLRGRAGAVRDIATSAVAALPFDRPQRRVSAAIDDLALLGGPDPVATLAHGRPVWRAGLLAEPSVLILPMAEAAPPSLVARLAQALDRGQHGLVALDEAAEDGEGLASALADRLGLFVTLEGERAPGRALRRISARDVNAARKRLPDVVCPTDLKRLLVTLADRLGIGSNRAVIACLRTARIIAALADRLTVSEEDLAQAVELSLAHRAELAAVAEEDEAPHAPPPENPPEPEDRPETEALDLHALTEMLVEVAKAALPKDILARLGAERAARAARGASGSGAAKAGNRRGRPLPSRAGRPDGRSRIDLVATLREAAPWQVLRRREAGGAPDRALIVCRSDYRLKRYREVSDRVLIFVVDASGSAAVARLGEAKGAVELMLAQAYSRRDHVALVVLRGTRAELVLPPTRSLVQTKTRLRGLPGGGGTPLASGLSTALTCALRARRQGMTPSIALLTDGRGNITLDGKADRPRAQDEAETLAQAIRAAGVPGVVLDVANRPQPALADLSRLMNSRYVPLPRADARQIAAALG